MIYAFDPISSTKFCHWSFFTFCWSKDSYHLTIFVGHLIWYMKIYFSLCSQYLVENDWTRTLYRWQSQFKTDTIRNSLTHFWILSYDTLVSYSQKRLIFESKSSIWSESDIRTFWLISFNWRVRIEISRNINFDETKLKTHILWSIWKGWKRSMYNILSGLHFHWQRAATVEGIRKKTSVGDKLWDKGYKLKLEIRVGDWA